MKKVLACLMVVCALLSFGCSGRNAAFGVVDIKKVEAEAPAVKTIKEDLQKKAKELQEMLGLKATAGLKRNYIEPAMRQGLIAMTIPDKPTSRNQRYYKIR